jgi:hypothetical protein
VSQMAFYIITRPTPPEIGSDIAFIALVLQDPVRHECKDILPQGRRAAETSLVQDVPLLPD